MNKNPFVPAPSYQPPLPPGPPPGAPAEFPAYWAAPQPAQAGYNAQWTPAQPVRPPAQNPFENYGYGNNWRPPQPQHPGHFAPAAPPAPPPGYNPYQPAVGYPQPYVPQAQPMAAFVPHPPQQPPQPQFFPQPQQQQRQPNPMHHTPPHQLPPAKRPRFDGPVQNNRGPPAPQPQFQPQQPPQMQQQAPIFSGAQRGGPPGPGGRGGQQGSRGRGGSFNNSNSNRGGAPMSGRGRGGGSSGSFAGSTNGRGGGQTRGHGSRGNFGNKDFHNRRGGGSFGGAGGSGSFSNNNNSGSFRGRNQTRNNNSSFGTRDGPSNSSFGSGKKDENRRTLTDFKIIGLEIRELAWTWGVVPSSVKAEPEEVSLSSEPKAPADGPKPVSDAGPPSRLRIYFHTPVTAVDSQPIPNNASFSLDALPSDSRKGKRKKIESDDGDDDAEQRRGPPPPPGLSDDRSSVAASVAPSVAETASEGDWLMAAITGDEPEGGGHDHDEHFDGEEPEAADGDGTFSAMDHDHDDARDHPDGSLSAPPPAGDDASSYSVSVSDGSVSTLVSSSLGEHPLSKLDEEEPILPDVDRAPTPPVEEPPSSAPSAGTNALSGAATLLSVENDDAGAVTSMAAEPTILVSSDTHEEPEQSQGFEATQIDEQSLTASTASTSQNGGDSQMPSQTLKTSTKVPAANRLSISYEGGNRRLVLDAEIVEGMTLFRKEGRAEVKMNLVTDGDVGLKGVYMETLSDVTKSYHQIESTTSSSDFPPFSQATPPLPVTLFIYLDTVRPLSEPKWVKTGDIPEWLKSLFGRMFWFAGDAAESWEKKIVVSDPDPPPTLLTVLEGWATSSGAGTLVERQKFLKTHLNEMDNVLEILLRLVRGNQPTPLASQTGSPLTGPLLSSIAPGSIHGAQQTPVSLAVLAMFRMTLEYAGRAGGEQAKTDAEQRMGEIIRCLPPSQIHKALDSIYKTYSSHPKK
ncbi:Proteasome endopeptidase complex [Mycena chlorophos]|uniref:Proteasome endopeptidase complex n=1 Tax=Mycena chlorophos TaxID=658473 RepID=A0A8H6T9S3_MYCCL|nr:Proteasome endopeptidase complex [Mycena chlorophos]